MSKAITVKTFEQIMIGDLEAHGETYLLEQCKGVLSLNWEGNVERVLFNIPPGERWYEPIDKGGIPLYGFNSAGNIICCMVLLKKGEEDNKGNKYNKDIIFVAKAEKTDSWGWSLIQDK